MSAKNDSIKDGKVHWQGHVIGSPEPGWYVVMKDWLFYQTAELFHFSYKDGAARWAAKEVNK